MAKRKVLVSREEANEILQNMLGDRDYLTSVEVAEALKTTRQNVSLLRKKGILELNNNEYYTRYSVFKRMVTPVKVGAKFKKY